MSRFLKIVSAVLVLGSLMASGAGADRLILIPEGTTLSTGGLKAEYMSKFGGDGTVYLANVGISRLEIEGASFRNFSNGSGKADVISAQVSVLPETEFTPAVAVGVRDIGDASTGSNSLYGGRSYYLAASKKIPITGGIPILFTDVSVHAGLGTDSLHGLFFGVEGNLPFGVRISGEYDSRDFNFALSYKVIPTVKADLSFVKGDLYYGATFAMKL